MSQSTASPSGSAYIRPILLVSLAMLAGAQLRFWMLRKFFEVDVDSQLYGGIAKNILQQGRYAFSDGNGVLHSTLIRLPGYPLYLAACFRLFGMENYFAAACVQIVLELAGCLVLGLLAYRLSHSTQRMRAALITVWLSALCPFTAIYAAEPLTECLTLFTITLAIWGAVRFEDSPRWSWALLFTGSVTYAALLRPDGALVAVAFAPPVLLRAYRLHQQAVRRGSEQTKLFPQPGRVVAVCLLLAVTPFAAWMVRNWRVFQVIQPLAPRYATDPGEETWPGWQRWMKTWCIDYNSTYQIYWNMPDAPLDVQDLPSRAFDSPAQQQETAALFQAYEDNHEDLTPALDDGFTRLAQERVAAHPLRYYVTLPLARIADMWLRPRVENLPIDLDWWNYGRHRQETRFSWAYVALNTFYLLVGFAGLCLRPRLWCWMLLYMILRSALLATIEAPEARYTLECFPMLFVLGGVFLAWVTGRRVRSLHPSQVRESGPGAPQS